MCKKGMLILTACLSLLLLQGCSIPPTRLNWQNEPGKIQPVNCNPQSPYCHL